MTKNIEYSFYNGEYLTSVDRKNEVITVYERGGWSRDYKLTLKELLKYAKQWEIEVDLQGSDENLAQIGTNIVLANNAVEHGLDPFNYVPKRKSMTDLRDKKIVEKFEDLFNKYEISYILSVMNEGTKEALKNELNK